MIRWDAPGPYEVVFSTRKGGVSDGPFASLNLGLLTDDAPENVAENRRRLCEATGADGSRLAMNRQVHGSEVHPARPGSRGVRGDGLWTEEPALPMLAFVADCLPVALARTGGDVPALAILHVGWQGLLTGIVERGAALLGRSAAVVGPGIGPCCYEVGEEVLAVFRELDGVAAGRMLDLAAVARRKLETAGVDRIEHVALCTSCRRDLFFSHRRDGGVTGRQGGLVWRTADGG